MLARRVAHGARHGVPWWSLILISVRQSENVEFVCSVCSIVATHGAVALLGNERRQALPLIDAFARTFHVPYVSVTSPPPNAAAVMATRDAASRAGPDDDRAFVLYIRPSYRKAIVDVVRHYRWSRIYYIYTEPEGTVSIYHHHHHHHHCR